MKPVRPLNLRAPISTVMPRTKQTRHRENLDGGEKSWANLQCVLRRAAATVCAIAVTVGVGGPAAAVAERSGNQQLRITGGLHLSHPFGVAVDPNRHVMYIGDSLNNRVLALAPSGTILRRWRGWGHDVFSQPGAVAVGRGGSFYVVDYGNNRIDRFAADGRPLQHWGSYGTASGKFAVAQDVATDRAGNVYVADALNFRIQKFSSTGHFLAAWTTLIPREEHLLAPMGVAVAPDGDVYVSEVAAATDSFGSVVEASNPLHCVQRFSPEGSPLVRWGTRGTLPGQFREPRGVVVDEAGEVYVADFGNNRIEQFSRDGTFQRSIGPQVRHGLRLHGPVALALDGRVGIYVADWFNSRIGHLSASGSIVDLWR